MCQAMQGDENGEVRHGLCPEGAQNLTEEERVRGEFQGSTWSARREPRIRILPRLLKQQGRTSGKASN